MGISGTVTGVLATLLEDLLARSPGAGGCGHSPGVDRLDSEPALDDVLYGIGYILRSESIGVLHGSEITEPWRVIPVSEIAYCRRRTSSLHDCQPT